MLSHPFEEQQPTTVPPTRELPRTAPPPAPTVPPTVEPKATGAVAPTKRYLTLGVGLVLPLVVMYSLEELRVLGFRANLIFILIVIMLMAAFCASLIGKWWAVVTIQIATLLGESLYFASTYPGFFASELKYPDMWAAEGFRPLGAALVWTIVPISIGVVVGLYVSKRVQRQRGSKPSWSV